MAAFVVAGTIGTPVAADSSDEGAEISAELTETEEPAPPPPACWWESVPATPGELARWQRFWQTIDGGLQAHDVVVFVEDGTIRQTFISRELTFVLEVRVCSDPDDDRHGRQQWDEVGPPRPTSLWTELTRRVTRLVPVPDADLGMSAADDGSVEAVVHLGLWISVSNADDIVARAELPSGAWSQATASLHHIEFDPGTGAGVVTCDGAGTPLPDDPNVLEQGPCGFTYRTVDDLGSHTATVRAIWHVTTTASTGESARQPDIVLETDIAIHVIEIQTIGTTN